MPAEGWGSEGKLPLRAPAAPREASECSGTSRPPCHQLGSTHGDAQHGPVGFSMGGCSRGEHPSTQCWSSINGTPQTNQQSTRIAQPYLRDSEAMGLGMGRSFAEGFAAGPWHSWERGGKG